MLLKEEEKVKRTYKMNMVKIPPMLDPKKTSRNFTVQLSATTLS